MTVFTAIVELTKASWRVLRRHPTLIWFPILSLLTTILVFALIGPILIDEDLSWAAVFIILFLVHLVHVFWTVGLTGEALKALRGESPITIRGGVEMACGRVPSIASF